MAGKSAAAFNIDLARFGKLTREQATRFFRKIALDLDTAVVFDTPVDTGRARGNWYPSLGTPSEAMDEDAKGAAASVARIQGTVATAPLGSIIWLTNNLPYILSLENGHSGQAPNGMVEVNVNRIITLFGR